jgi:hypothetical protein
MFQIVKALRAVEQRLGGDAADVETGAAEEFAFDAGDAHPKLSGADGGGVSAGSSADDDKIEIGGFNGQWIMDNG